jgi:uncharacterized membrane protein
MNRSAGRTLSRALRSVLLRGLVTVLPVMVTLYLLWWLAAAGEALFGAALRTLLPTGWYVPGLGLLGLLVLVFMVGLMTEAWLVRSLVRMTEQALERIPLVKTVFGGVRDLAAFVTGGGQERLTRTVHVAIAPDIGLIGFITRDDAQGLLPPGRAEDCVAVYLPMSYQVGGFTVLVPRERLTPLDMPAPEALRLILTAGVKAPPRR